MVVLMTWGGGGGSMGYLNLLFLHIHVFQSFINMYTHTLKIQFSFCFWNNVLLHLLGWSQIPTFLPQHPKC